MDINDGLTLRASSLEDAASVLALYRRVAQVPGGLARLPFEITMPYVESFLEPASTRGVGVVAESAAGVVLGEIHAYSPAIFCFSHILTDLTIAVDPKLQGSGLGRRLFTTFLQKVIDERPHISRVELIARESNTRAIKFYESMGFEREGELRGRILNSDGSLESDIPMALHSTRDKKMNGFGKGDKDGSDR